MDVSAVAPFSNVECPTCQEPNRVKREFGHYTLTRRLAEGGMSLVFVAMDNTLGREVALKILNEDYSQDERRIQAFEEEARITASFSHPHVVRVFTTGRAFGRFYIAMELVPGGHFEHQIRERGKIPEIEILPFAIQVAEGLEAARAAGLIHRDIKPGNILLDSQGSAKIVDFGLALVTKGGSATAQEIWATPYYVPPETIEGHAEDFRSDLYAFGATLYHALAGKPPCDEQSMATDVLRQAKKHIKPLRSAAPDVSDETCAIIDKAMAYDPKARFSSYEEMIRQLTSALKRIKKGGGASSGNLKRKTSRRGEWLAVGAAGVMLLAAIGGGIAWIVREEPVKEEPQPLVIQAPAINEEPGNATLIGQRYRTAREAVKAGDYEKARETFAALRDDADVQEPTRTWAAVEAVVVTYLDGRAADARKEAKAASEHIHSTDLAEKKMGERLLRALGHLDELAPVKQKDPDASGDDASWALALMLGGLKNWEQGLIDLAATDYLGPVSSAQLKGKDQWVGDYQEIAKVYLADHRVLKDPLFNSIPSDPGSCQTASRELDGLLTRLKTKGRARFNVRAFQLDLARQVKLLTQPKIEEPVAAPPVIADNPPATPTITSPVPPIVPKEGGSVLFPFPEMVPTEDPLPKIQALSKACRFEEAAELIKSLQSDPQGATREALLAINSAAMSFLAFLESDIPQSTTPIQLRLKNGETLNQVKVVKPGWLAAGASAAEYSWSDIDPESVIQLYRTNSRNRVAEIDKLQRHESAIAYDWLVGDRARAALAAERLGSDSPIFKRRWDTLVTGLPK